MSEPPASIRRIGIVCGVGEELKAFLPGHPREMLREPGVSVELMQWQGKDVFATCLGVGKVAAAAAATWLYTRHAVQMLLVIGTAGKIGAIEGDVFNIAEAVQSDFGARKPHGLVHYAAGTLPIGPPTLEAFRAWSGRWLGLPDARIATSDLFVECDVHAKVIGEALGAPLVDMETAAVAQVASLLGLPWVAIKATTDDADPSSAGSFAENLATAARASADAAARFIAEL